MGTLIFSMIESLDGYVADDDGRFEWAMPDESVHVFANELERPVGMYLYGRRMYEVMAVWETLGLGGDEPEYIREYAAIWRAADKVVYSKTLDAAHTARTHIERTFDAEAIRRLKRETDARISVGGPNLAAQLIEAGLVDEYQFFVAPIIVGGGIRSLPEGVRVRLELTDERRFSNGMVFLNYRFTDAQKA